MGTSQPRRANLHSASFRPPERRRRVDLLERGLLGRDPLERDTPEREVVARRADPEERAGARRTTEAADLRVEGVPRVVLDVPPRLTELDDDRVVRVARDPVLKDRAARLRAGADRVRIGALRARVGAVRARVGTVRARVDRLAADRRLG